MLLYIFNRTRVVFLVFSFVLCFALAISAFSQTRIKQIHEAPGQKVVRRGITITYTAGAVGNAELSYQAHDVDAYVNDGLVASTQLKAGASRLNWDFDNDRSFIPQVPPSGPFGVVPNPPRGETRPYIADYTWHRLSFSSPVTINEIQNFFIGDIDSHELGTVVAYYPGGSYTYGTQYYNDHIHNGNTVGSALQQHSAFEFLNPSDQPNSPGQNDPRWLTMGQSSREYSSVASSSNYMTISLYDREVTDLVYYHTWTSGSAGKGYIIQSPDFDTILGASLHSIRSRAFGKKLKLSFKSASEENNVGFQVYRVDNNGEHQPVGELIPSKCGTKNTHTRYKVELPYDGSFKSFYLATVDTNGEEQLYGAYTVGEQYGKDEVGPKIIDWSLIEGKLLDSGYTKSNGRFISRFTSLSERSNKRLRKNYQRKLARYSQKPLKSKRPTAQVAVPANKPGFYEVKVQDLSLSGIDFGKKRAKNIAVLFNGVPVSRVIKTEKNSPFLGDNGSIIFYHEGLDNELKRYNSEAVYEIVQDSRVAISSSLPSEGVGNNIADSSWASVSLNEDKAYDPGLPNDGWYMARMLRRKNNLRKSFTLEIDRLESEQGRVIVNLLGVTDWPGANDHHARVYVNNELVADEYSDGLTEWTIEEDVNTLNPGSNVITVELVADTGRIFDVVNIDSLKLEYDRPLVGDGNSLAFTSTDRSFSVTNVDADYGVLAKVEGDPILYTLSAFVTGNNELLFASPKRLSNAKVSYAVGGVNPVLSVIRKKKVKLLPKERTNLVILTHGSFMNNPSLANFVTHKKQSGYRTKVIDIEDVFTRYGFGHRSVSAIQDYLRQVRDLKAVLLVGGDTVDYLDNLGKSISFIPTAYVKNGILNHVPHDGKLADFDGDGWSDVAIGRWPVRTNDELSLLAERSLSYEQQIKAGSIKGLVLSERGFSGYGDQTGKLFEHTAETVELLAIDNIIDELYPESLDSDEGDEEKGRVIPKTAERQALEVLKKRFSDALASGVDLISYGGHASADRWGQKLPLLRSGEISKLNFARPVGIVMLACYTTDFVNPEEDTFVHQWMFGHNSTANGAAFIVGATSVSSYSGNLNMVRSLLETQDTPLASLLSQAKQNLSEETAKTWNFLGDPTLVLPRAEKQR